jgi:hypothetical protein
MTDYITTQINETEISMELVDAIMFRNKLTEEINRHQRPVVERVNSFTPYKEMHQLESEIERLKKVLEENGIKY